MDRETKWMSITELEWVSYGIGMDRTDEHYRVGMDIQNKYMEWMYETGIYGTNGIWNRQYMEQIYGADIRSRYMERLGGTDIWNGYAEQRYMEQI